MPVERSQVDDRPYPYWWFPQIMVQAEDPNADATVTIVAIPFRVEDDGSRTLQVPAEAARMPVRPGGSSPVKRLRIDNLFASSDFDETKQGALLAVLADCTTAQKLGLAQTALFAAVEARGKDMGVL